MSAIRRLPRESFRILVLADFSGRASRAVAEPGRGIAKRRLVRVDRDTLDAALAAMSPEVRLASGATLALGSFDDLRPEAISSRLAETVRLRGLRDRLFAAATAADAAEEARAQFGDEAPHAPAPSGPRPELPADGEGLLSAILGSAPAERTASDAFDDIVRDVSGPSVERMRVPRGPADRDTLAARIDAALGAALSATLHDASFRAVEGAWRSVEFLVRRLDLGTEIELHLLDVSRAEAFDDVGVSGGFDASGLHRVIVENTVGTQGAARWSLVVTPWSFGATPRDVAALLRLGRLALAAETTFVACAEPSVAGCRSLGATPDPDDWREAGDPAGRELWRALRRVPEAAHVALVWPRFLLRLPYGAKTSPVEGLRFEEFSGAPQHEQLLWCSGAFAVAFVLGRAFEALGPDYAEGIDPEIDDLPALVVERAGDAGLQPAAETWLRTRGIDRATSQGLLPLLSVQGTAAVRLGNLNSLADPPAALI